MADMSTHFVPSPHVLAPEEIRHFMTWPRWLLSANLLLVVAAELTVAYTSPVLGLLLYALLLNGLVILRALIHHDVEQKLTLVLFLVPLSRIIVLGMPLARLPEPVWPLVTMAPLLIAAFLVSRQLGISRREIGLSRGNLRTQLMIAAGGPAIGALAFAILRPAEILASASWSTFWLPVMFALICAGFGEELIFRGIIQATTLPAVSRWALVYGALLFAALHIGQLSAPYLLFIFVVGLVFAATVHASGSILGVSLAHIGANLTLLLGMPAVIVAPGTQIRIYVVVMLTAGAYLALLAVATLLIPRGSTASAANPSTMKGMRALRLKHGLRYIDLAERSGLPARLLAEIEYGLYTPQSEQVYHIARGLGVDPNALFQSHGLLAAP